MAQPIDSRTGVGPPPATYSLFVKDCDKAEVECDEAIQPDEKRREEPSTLQKVVNFMKTHKETLFTTTASLTLMVASITLCSFGLLPLAAAIISIAIIAGVIIGGIMELQAIRERDNRFQ